jgi:hypothetical protein
MEPTTSDTKLGTVENNWSEAEHVTDTVQLEAQKLVHLAGNAEIAKHAIDVASQAETSSSGAVATNSDQVVSNNPTGEFHDALAEFERLLGLPVINGELQEWVTSVSDSFERVKTLLLDKLHRNHSEVFSRILKEDLDRSSRVESLRVKDNQLAEQELREVECGINALQQYTKTVGKDESQLNDLLSRFSRQAFMFIVSVRAQETAIATWLNEAFNRDLGVSG